MNTISFVILRMIQCITRTAHSHLPYCLLIMLAALTPTAMKIRLALHIVISVHWIPGTFIGTFGCPTVLIAEASKLYLYLQGLVSGLIRLIVVLSMIDLYCLRWISFVMLSGLTVGPCSHSVCHCGHRNGSTIRAWCGTAAVPRSMSSDGQALLLSVTAMS